MAVFRIEKTRDYTVMSNYHLRDMSLSLKAQGLLDGAIYTALIHFNSETKETAKDKIKRLIRKEVERE